MQPVSLSAPSQLPQETSFEASLDNATPAMQGQNFKFYSRSLNKQSSADLNLKIRDQQSYIEGLSHYYQDIYTPALTEANKIAPYISTIDKKGSHLFSYQNTNGWRVPALTYLAENTSNGKKFVDLVTDIQHGNQPRNNLQRAKDNLDAINKRLTEISAKETLKNRHVREFRALNKAIGLQGEIITSFTTEKANLPPASLQTYFWHPDHPRTQAQSSSFPHYADEEHSSWPAEEAVNQKPATETYYTSLKAGGNEKLKKLNDFAELQINLLEHLDTPMHSGGTYGDSFPDNELMKTRDEFFKIGIIAQDLINNYPDAKKIIRSSPVLEKAKKLYTEKLVPLLNERKISSQFQPNR